MYVESDIVFGEFDRSVECDMVVVDHAWRWNDVDPRCKNHDTTVSETKVSQSSLARLRITTYSISPNASYYPSTQSKSSTYAEAGNAHVRTVTL